MVSPSAVFWGISGVDVNAVYAVFGRWAVSHIGIKRLKRRSPLFAYGDSSAAVVGISFVGGVVASGNHAVPRSVFFGLRHPVSYYAVAPSAAARFCVARSKAPAGSNRLVPAIANAAP